MLIKSCARFRFLLAGLLIVSLLLVGCAPAPLPPVEIGEGASKEDVIASLGEPLRTQEFILPAEPFFGPQEGLAALLPPGTVVEEWVYERGEEDLYIWFAGEEGQAQEDWRVVAKGSYPRDAVY